MYYICGLTYIQFALSLHTIHVVVHISLALSRALSLALSTPLLVCSRLPSHHTRMSTIQSVASAGETTVAPTGNGVAAFSLPSNTPVDQTPQDVSNKQDYVQQSVASTAPLQTAETIPSGSVVAPTSVLAADKTDEGVTTDPTSKKTEHASSKSETAAQQSETAAQQNESSKSDAVTDSASESEYETQLTRVWNRSNEQLSAFHQAIQTLTECAADEGTPLSAKQLQAIHSASESVNGFKDGFKQLAQDHLRATDSISDMKGAKVELERRLDEEFQNGLTDLSQTLQVLAPNMGGFLDKLKDHYSQNSHPAVKQLIHSLASVTSITGPLAAAYQARVVSLQDKTTQQQQQQKQQELGTKSLDSQRNDSRRLLVASTANATNETTENEMTETADEPENESETETQHLTGGANASTTQDGTVYASEQTRVDPTSINATNAASGASAATGGMALQTATSGDQRSVTQAMTAAILGMNNMNSMNNRAGTHEGLGSYPNKATRASNGDDDTRRSFEERMYEGAKSVSDANGPSSARLPFNVGGGTSYQNFASTWKAELDEKYSAEQAKLKESRLIASTARATGAQGKAKPLTARDIDLQIEHLLAQKAATLTPDEVKRELATCGNTMPTRASAQTRFPASAPPPALHAQTSQEPLTFEARASASGHSGSEFGPPTLGHFASLPRKSQNANIESHPLNNFFGINQPDNESPGQSLDATLTGRGSRPGSWMGKRSYVESQAAASQRTLSLEAEGSEQGWRTAPYSNAKRPKVDPSQTPLRPTGKTGFEAHDTSSENAAYNNFFAHALPQRE
jgi:hypothetical protein